MNCKEYQEDLRIKAANDKAAQETQKMLEVYKPYTLTCYIPGYTVYRIWSQKERPCIVLMITAG